MFLHRISSVFTISVLTITFRVFTVHCDVILQCFDQTSVRDCRKFHAISSIYRTGNEVPVESGEDAA